MKGGAGGWIVNLISFILLALLALTGVAAWLLPHGGGAALQGGRRLLHAAHRTGALLFLVAIGVHIWWHRGTILLNLRKYGILQR
jgi:hypothetical protein